VKPHVAIDGLAELRKALKQVDSDLAKEVALVNRDVAEIVADAARGRVPKRTGRTASNLRAGAQQRYGIVRFGGAKAPHAGWLEFGGRRPRDNVTRPIISEGRYIYPALRNKRDKVVSTYADKMEQLLRRAGLL
jgi:HK97 gp10 family phage protein